MLHYNPSLFQPTFLPVFTVLPIKGKKVKKHKHWVTVSYQLLGSGAEPSPSTHLGSSSTVCRTSSGVEFSCGVCDAGQFGV